MESNEQKDEDQIQKCNLEERLMMNRKMRTEDEVPFEMVIDEKVAMEQMNVFGL